MKNQLIQYPNILNMKFSEDTKIYNIQSIKTIFEEIKDYEKMFIISLENKKIEIQTQEDLETYISLLKKSPMKNELVLIPKKENGELIIQTFLIPNSA